ncbi:ribosome maturation factor RimM [Nocardioides baekrokdamisoli]|uniref:Ribosome maturation factor RimM n=1 Tax=Nocardioides baekrokdamisoli TaxID=1804624 RepID=A0A3G9J467_9ACTN|nr:ribosome maturation factor RimM [Nocardioides baekrokdamisoli]BBH18214.1 ribosome maturation factor RimM [Nocardioides baekrokdamisoli]
MTSTVEVLVGRIGKPHGIKGYVTIDVRTDEPERRFAAGQSLMTAPPSGVSRGPEGAPAWKAPKTLTVVDVRWHQGVLHVLFDGYSNRNEAEALRGTLLRVNLTDADVPEDPDEFYDHQLIGLSAYDLDGTHLGEVVNVSHGSAQDLLIIKTSDGREALVPFVTALVPTVDLTEKRVVIADRPGLVTPLDD